MHEKNFLQKEEEDIKASIDGISMPVLIPIKNRAFALPPWSDINIQVISLTFSVS